MPLVRKKPGCLLKERGGRPSEDEERREHHKNLVGEKRKMEAQKGIYDVTSRLVCPGQTPRERDLKPHERGGRAIEFIPFAENGKKKAASPH